MKKIALCSLLTVLCSVYATTGYAVDALDVLLPGFGIVRNVSQISNDDLLKVAAVSPGTAMILATTKGQVEITEEVASKIGSLSAQDLQKITAISPAAGIMLTDAKTNIALAEMLVGNTTKGITTTAATVKPAVRDVSPVVSQGGNCSKTVVSYDGTQKPGDGEFLYETETDWRNAQTGFNSTKTSGAGKAIECDRIHSYGCTDGQTVTLPAGHYFKGKRKDMTITYKCNARLIGYDEWEVVSTGEYCTSSYGNIEVGSKRHVGKYDCSGFEKTEKNEDLVKTWDLHCLKGKILTCYPAECAEGYTVQDGKCVKQGETTPPTPVTPVKGCDGFKQYPERYACCNMGKLTTWTGAVTNGTCTCKDTNTEWKFYASAGRGQCEPKQTVTPPVDDNPKPEQECTYTFRAGVRCANGAFYEAGHTIKFDKSEWQGQSGANDQEKCNNFIKQWTTDLTRTRPILEGFKEKYCVISEAEFSDAKSRVSSFVSAAKKNASVWKDAEGNFNGVRLASDLTAGVVLGTVGGVVSGVVIKKKQIEKGFDVLHCAVGGQTVADWGDEFSVGLTR